MKLRLVAGMPVVLLPLALVYALQYWPVAVSVVLAVAYLAALVVAGIAIQLEKTTRGRR